MAYELVKAVQADGLDRGEGYRPLGRRALPAIMERRVDAAAYYRLDGLGIDAGRIGATANTGGIC